MAEGTGPVKPGNLFFNKVPNPADYPKDEVLYRSFESGIVFRGERDVKNAFYIGIGNGRSSG